MGGLFNTDKPFGSSVDPSKATYDYDTGTPENIEALRLDAEYDPDTGEPVNESAVSMEKLYDEFAVKEDSKSEFDYNKALEGSSKIGDMTPKAIGGTGRIPGVDLPSEGGQRRLPMPNQYPYAAPSYLQGSQAYNSQVGKLVNTLLSTQIRGRSIRSLI
jgi:hypothetical protein